jgi:hypothetical protein
MNEEFEKEAILIEKTISMNDVHPVENFNISERSNEGGTPDISPQLKRKVSSGLPNFGEI